MRQVVIDGSPAAVTELSGALRAALDGSGPPVCPVNSDMPVSGSEPAAGIALMVRTSGSTGDAKGVLLSAFALRTSATATHRRLGGPGRWLLALPVRHIAGLQVLVRSILAGHEPGLLDTSVGFRPEGFAAAAAGVLALGGPRYTALVPTQLARLVEAGGAGLRALCGFDAVLLGGAAAPGALLDRARAAGIRVVTTYGMTETAGGCVYDGVPLDGVRVRLGAGGVVEIAGPTLASGYWDRPLETRAAFVDGWFRTGDLGRLDADGTLEVYGRVDDVISTGGLKVAAAAVEKVLVARPGVVEACVVGLPDPEWGQRVVAAVVGGSTVDDDDLRAAVRAELGAFAVPRVIRRVDRLPLRGPGKVDRAAVADLF